MDPVTAFSLAAGVLQVLDLSFKALSKCKEIYKDGSLAQHRDAQTITEFLAQTTKRLEKSVQSVSNPNSEEAKDVIEVSKECSATATALLSELQSLQLKPGSSLFQAFRKTTRAVRRKIIIAETEEKLDKYQKILNTRILSKLDAQAILQIDQSRKLDQSVRDLAKALDQGRGTVVQLLADQTVTIQEHVDRRFDDQACEEAMQRAQQQFKDSLFFPEIFARQDDVPKSHEGTCRWIFDSPPAVPRKNFTGGDLTRKVEPQPWSNFTEWLENDQGTYWLSGKPGSGKSTLMKYITSEFRDFYRSRAALHCWGSEADLVTCSIFFWALGSPMQKNYVGFLRSLLYQIAEQRGDLIPMIMGQEAISGASSHPREHLQIHAWTKERLDDALRRFLSGKPSSISVCVFVDGLDEFAGDEDLLMELIRLLSQTSHIHVCVSSRPEQIFRQGFASSPHLRLQDLNYEDIKKATEDRLDTTLKEQFPQQTWMSIELVANVIAKAQGIFLWADLVTKDLKKGARNSDSIQELRDRLESTPNTIEGLYEQMLERLDKPYFQEAARYFQMLTANQDYLALYHDEDVSSIKWNSVPTLLHCACADEKAWDYVLSHDLEHFQSPKFHDLCRNLETRILTRCAGLVEISEVREGFIEGVENWTNEGRLDFCVDTSQAAQNLSYYLREIRFIHKTVIDFLQSHEAFFRDPEWRLTATLTIIRGKIGVVGLTPIIIREKQALPGRFTITKTFIMRLLSRPSLVEALWPTQVPSQAVRDINIQIFDQVYEVFNYVSKSLNGLDHTLSETLSNPNIAYMWDGYCVPFHDCLGFAAFFGGHAYVSRYTAQSKRSEENTEYVLRCAISGLSIVDSKAITVTKMDLLATGGFLRIVMDFLPQSRKSHFYIGADLSSYDADRQSKWTMFLDSSHGIVEELVGWQSELGSSTTYFRSLQQATQLTILWMDTVACFLKHGADPNRIFSGFLSNDIPDNDTLEPYDIVGIIVTATVLAWVEKVFEFADPALTKKMEDLLRSHGGQYRKKFVSLDDASDIYRLTREQSDRLHHAWSFEGPGFPPADPRSWSVETEEEEQELVDPDPITERKLEALLKNIDRHKIYLSQGVEDPLSLHEDNSSTALDTKSP